MAQTPSLRRINMYGTDDIAFATALRNQNRAAFFDDRTISFTESYNWHQSQADRDFYIIWLGNRRAGTIAVQHREDCEFLQNLCVDEWARGRGIARWAICQLMKPGRFIIAQVKPDNKHVIKMYEELGFWRVR